MHLVAQATLAALMGALSLLLAAPSGATASPPSIDATLSLGEIALPESKLVRRELMSAFGKEIDSGLREAVAGALVDLRAFRAIVAEPGDVHLEVEVLDLTRNERDMANANTDVPVTLRVNGRLHFRWLRAGSELHVGDIETSVNRSIIGAPKRGALGQSVRELVRKATTLSFSELYESRVFEPIGDGRSLDPRAQP